MGENYLCCWEQRESNVIYSDYVFLIKILNKLEGCKQTDEKKKTLHKEFNVDELSTNVTIKAYNYFCNLSTNHS